MASSLDHTRADPARHPHYNPALRRGLHIEDYRFARWLSLLRAAEVRRQRAYFPHGSVPFRHYTLRLRNEQRRMLSLREQCRMVREVSDLLQVVRK